MPALPKPLRRFLSGSTLAALAALVLWQSAPALAGSQEEALAAARRGSSGTLARLLESRAVSPDTKDENGDSLLILAVREGNVDAASTVLKFRPSVDYRNKVGDSALMLAASKGEIKILDQLLASGAHTDHGKGEHAWTALHYAAFEGNQDALEHLLAAGADVNALTPNLSNALMLAARNGHTGIVRRLLQTPVDLAQRNDRGLDAEEWARSKGNTRVAELIGQARASRPRR